jgi:hypothetical protein
MSLFWEKRLAYPILCHERSDRVDFGKKGAAELPGLVEWSRIFGSGTSGSRAS